MKIGIICYPTLGGSGVVATELGHELALRGHDIHFITYEPPFRLRLDVPNIYFHQVEIYQYDLFRYPDYALTLAVKIAEISKKYDLDILHVHYAIPHATSAYLAKQILGTKRPYVITTLHGTDITLVGQEPAYFEIVKFSIEQSNGITTVSQNLKSATLESFSLSKDIKVIHNFFIPQLDLIGKKTLHKSLAPKGEKILLHSSNLRPVKKIEDVFRIFLKVREHIPVKLVILGHGSGLEILNLLVLEHGVKNDVICIGTSINIDPYISSADIFLLPSLQESFGLAALEAMAYGIPAITSDVGGLPEVVEHNVSGFLAPVGDVGTMAQYAIDLLTDEILYKRISKAARRQACEKFCPSKIIPEYEAYYQTVSNTIPNK
jgi:N-acetyl-alpha-D-glucosaminyl L-malate synthase BshA